MNFPFRNLAKSVPGAEAHRRDRRAARQSRVQATQSQASFTLLHAQVFAAGGVGDGYKEEGHARCNASDIPHGDSPNDSEGLV